MTKETGKSIHASDKTIGEIVANDFRTAKVFENHRIDFCCGGNVALGAACKAKGLDLAAIIRELDGVKTTPTDRSQNYASWEIPFLADYIMNTHHMYLKENLESIGAYANKIAEVHGEHHPEVVEIASIYDKLSADMTAHLKEEEEVFFPAIKRTHTARKAGSAPAAKDVETIKASLKKLGAEHEVVGDAIHKIRHLAKEYVIPAGVCNTYVVTYEKLKDFEDDLHKHVHLENNILFLKASQS